VTDILLTKYVKGIPILKGEQGEKPLDEQNRNKASKD
jgi:hypothetical protein